MTVLNKVEPLNGALQNRHPFKKKDYHFAFKTVGMYNWYPLIVTEISVICQLCSLLCFKEEIFILSHSLKLKAKSSDKIPLIIDEDFTSLECTSM